MNYMLLPKNPNDPVLDLSFIIEAIEKNPLIVDWRLIENLYFIPDDIYLKFIQFMNIGKMNLKSLSAKVLKEVIKNNIHTITKNTYLISAIGQNKSLTENDIDEIFNKLNPTLKIFIPRYFNVSAEYIINNFKITDKLLLKTVLNENISNDAIEKIANILLENSDKNHLFECIKSNNINKFLINWEIPMDILKDNFKFLTHDQFNTLLYDGKTKFTDDDLEFFYNKNGIDGKPIFDIETFYNGVLYKCTRLPFYSLNFLKNHPEIYKTNFEKFIVANGAPFEVLNKYFINKTIPAIKDKVFLQSLIWYEETELLVYLKLIGKGYIIEQYENYKKFEANYKK